METKYIFLLALTFLFVFACQSGLQAQAVSIQASQVNHEGDAQACITIQMEPEVKATAQAWKKYLKKTHGVKMSGKRPMQAEEVQFGAIAAQTMDFYTDIAKVDNRTEMKVYARLGYDDYLSSNEHPNSFAAMKSVATVFVRGFLQDYYAAQIDDASKSLEKMRKTRVKYQKESEGLRNANEDLTSEIKKLERKVEQNENRGSDLEELIGVSTETIKTQEATLNQIREKYNSIPNK